MCCGTFQLHVHRHGSPSDLFHYQEDYLKIRTSESRKRSIFKPLAVQRGRRTPANHAFNSYFVRFFTRPDRKTTGKRCLYLSVNHLPKKQTLKGTSDILRVLTDKQAYQEASPCSLACLFCS